MKNLLFFAFFTLLLFSKNLIAQVSKVIPPDADDFYNKSMPLLRSQVKDIILKTAKTIENRKIDADSLSLALHRDMTLKSMSNNDIEGVIVLIMVQATKDADADADLKRMVLDISHKNDQKKEGQEEINQVQNLKLRMIRDRKSDMAEEVSYAMKKISGTQQNIINNLK